ncbi:MAG: hypothetical protein IT379_13975 [Deltaproteobacteria bacterium]|nr:hypothetical protein [Deltaproteobacteria bacterium]
MAEARVSRPPVARPRLERIVPEGKRLVTPELVSGALPAHSAATLGPFLEMLDIEIDLGPLGEAVDSMVAASTPFDTEIDRGLAPTLHRALPVSRRDAADPGIWRYLAIAFRPGFVRHRWENRSWATMRSRFWSPGTRPDSNAFGRLWWIAELTVGDDGDYSLTDRVLRRQTLATSLFVRSLASWRPAVVAAVDVLEHESAEQIERCLVGFSRLAATVPLESMGEDDVRDHLERIAARARAGR